MKRNSLATVGIMTALLALALGIFHEQVIFLYGATLSASSAMPQYAFLAAVAFVALVGLAALATLPIPNVNRQFWSKVLRIVGSIVVGISLVGFFLDRFMPI